MSTCTGGCVRNVINLGNSIIGVSILAMPYCFQKCGILLSLLLIMVSGVITRASCHLLLKAAIMARRRNFEFLAFHTFGSTGKFAAELGIIGFLLGSCIAFFVVIGDLGPPLAADLLLMPNSAHLRVELLLFLGFVVGLPLGLLRKVDSLTSFSAMSVCFYVCLMLKIFSEAFPNLASDSLWAHLTWWKPEGVMSALPIFSMALSCQTQLFEIFDTLTDPSLKRMDIVVSGAVHMCTVVYSTVGIFGYIAFFDRGISGNILLSLSETALSKFVKLGFILTVVISFPLCLFPCRTSLHSLLYKQGVGHHDHSGNLIPDQRFRCLTTALVAVTVGTSIMLPNIELVLGIVGSTIGTTICFILPALVFIRITTKNTNERLIAQVVLSIGIFILVAGTYSTLHDANQPTTLPPMVATPSIKNADKNFVTPSSNVVQQVSIKQEKLVTGKPVVSPLVVLDNKLKIEENKVLEEKRQEPPVPQEPDEVKPVHIEEKLEKKPTDANPLEGESPLHPDALKKEDKEMEVQKEKKPIDVPIKSTEVKNDAVHRQDELLKKLEAQQEEQKQLIEAQKKLLEELRQHKESHDNDPKAKEPLKVQQQQNEIRANDPKESPISKEKSNKENRQVPQINQENPTYNELPQKETGVVKTELKESHDSVKKHSPSDLYHHEAQLPPNVNLREAQLSPNVNQRESQLRPKESTTKPHEIAKPLDQPSRKVPLPGFMPKVDPKVLNPGAEPIMARPDIKQPFQQVPVVNKLKVVPQAGNDIPQHQGHAARPLPNKQQQIAASNLVNNYITGNKMGNITKDHQSQPNGNIPNELNGKNEMRKLLQEDLISKNESTGTGKLVPNPAILPVGQS